MSCSRLVTTPLWLSGSLRFFLKSSSVYSCYLFLISSASVSSLLFLCFIVTILAWNIPLISPIFFKKSLVFPIVFSSSISLGCPFWKGFLSLLAISGTLHSVGYIFPFLPCLLHLFFLKIFVKLPQTIHLPSCFTFSLGWFWSLPPVQCYEPLHIVPQALYQMYLSRPWYNHKWFDLDHTWKAYWFSLISSI